MGGEVFTSDSAKARVRKWSVVSWRLDETYIKVKGRWTCLYRAVDRDGQTLDFMLSECRDLATARRFFKRAISANGIPDRAIINESRANLAGLLAVNMILKFTGAGKIIKILQVKYRNNIPEQDHRFIKRLIRLIRPMMGFISFASAAATIAGIEIAHMIRKGQFNDHGRNAFQQFVKLAA